MISERHTFAAAVLLLLTMPVTAHTQAPALRSAPDQELRVGIVQSWWSNDLLGRPLGIGVSYSSVLRGNHSLRVAYERHHDTFHSTGSTCAGLVPPGEDCADERRDSEADIRVVTLGLPTDLLVAARMRLRLVPAIRAAWLASDLRGERTGRELSANKFTLGGELGVELTRDFARTPWLRLHAGALAGFLTGTSANAVDAYIPFDSGITVTSLQLGAAIVW